MNSQSGERGPSDADDGHEQHRGRGVRLPRQRRPADAPVRGPARTKAQYAIWWPRWLAFGKETGFRVEPGNDEVLEEFARWLIAKGKYKPSSVRQAIAGVRRRHLDLELRPVPDTAKALAVVRAWEDGLGEAAAPAAATPLRLDDLRALIATLDLATAQGGRDRLLLTLAWRGMLGATQLSALDLGDVTVDRASGALRVFVTLGDIPPRRLHHKRHYDVVTHAGRSGRWKTVPAVGGDTCAVDAYVSHRAQLATAGITAGPLLRPVDIHDHIAGNAAGIWAGTPTLRLDSRAIVHAINRAAADAQRAGTWRTDSLRFGGADESLRFGADLFAVYDQGDWALPTAGPLRRAAGVRRAPNAMDGVR